MHTQRILCCAMSAKGGCVVTGSTDRKVSTYIRRGLNNSRESSYTLYGDLKRAENEHKRTKEHTRAMHDTGYMELERQTAIMGNLAVLAVVTALFGASFLRSSASN